MVNVQCRNGEKCRKPGCDFVHPSDPRWAAARSANGRNSERDRRQPPARKGSGSEWGTSTNKTPLGENTKKWRTQDSNNGKKSESAWNYEQQESPTSSPALAESSWGIPSSSKDSIVAPASSGGGWGGSSDSSTQRSGWDMLPEDAGAVGNNATDQWGGSGASASSSWSVGWGDPETGKTGNDPASANSKPSESSSWGSDNKANDSQMSTNLDPPSSSWGSGGRKTSSGTTAPVNPISPRLPDWSSVNIDAGGSGNTTNRRSSTGDWSSVNEGPRQPPPSFDAKGKGKAKATDRTRDLSPVLMPPPPVPPVATSSLASNRRPPPPLKLDTMPYTSQSVSSPLYAPASSKSPAILHKLPTRLQPSSNSLTSAAQKMALAAKRNKSPSKPPGQRKRSRHELYQSTLRHMQNAVILHIELRKAQEEDERWKKTQVSSIYGHATQATRKMLNSQRSQYSQRAINLKEELNREIFALSHLPDFLAPIHAPVDLLTREMVAGYTQELKLWFQDLELHKRLLVDEQPEQENPDQVDQSSNVNVDGIISDAQAQPDTSVNLTEDCGRRPSELLQQKKWTWKDLLKAAEVVEQRLSDTEAEFFFNAFTNISICADDNLANLATQLSVDEEIQELNVETRDIKYVSAAVRRAGVALSSQAVELTALLARVDELQKELDQTTLERKYFDSVNEQAVKYYPDFERWKEEDKIRIASLTTQIRDLHSLRKRKRPVPPPPPETITTLPPSISMDVLLDYIKPIITNMMKSEIEVALSGLRSRCIENQHRLKDDLLREANVISRQADLVRARVQELKSIALPGINAVAQGVLPGPASSQPSH